ncbi:hypothetical protein Kisp01_29910 [Kineosporia sp. NBRC 101677]|uniref:VOC family protein n=1 Tax=Kineosporia sp. NBRC 101677 TaxID=3032197 RepID=UPI0024A5D854|nr:VOC family protein [Kineosporia sp. NBRC 101677]GLY15976.1 hypothetical protein Kisp01_29910 [Kineosporia sp. NBRC 101677]
MSDPDERLAQRLTEQDETVRVTQDARSGGLDDLGDLRVGAVVINTRDMGRAVRFWMRALGYRLRDSDIDPDFTVLVHPAGVGVPISLQRTDHPPAEPARVHLDLYTAEQERHVERLVGLGATRLTEWERPDGADWVVLKDPDGNEFCLVNRSDAQY